MHEKEIEGYISETLTGTTQKSALEFASHLRVNEMEFERCQNGYWQDKLYWFVKYKTEYVCFILINGYKEKEWTIWSDDSSSNCFEDFPLDENLKEIAWENVDLCGNCGSCSGGTYKKIIGKEFDNVCGTTFRFANPNVLALEFIKKMVVIRKNDILRNKKA